MKNRNLLLILLMGLSMVLNAQTVTIGTQVWRTKNLDVSTFRNGDPIPEAKTDEEWKKAVENKQPAWCNYDNNPANGSKYGKLYNWDAVNDPRGLAPKGYHVPTDAEWKVLTDYLGGESEAGTEMKSTSGWKNNGNGTNSSKFSGLPGGTRGSDGTFDGVGKYGYWWSSTELETYDAWVRGLNRYDGWVRGLNRYDGGVFPDYFSEGEGMSVRCLRD